MTRKVMILGVVVSCVCDFASATIQSSLDDSRIGACEGYLDRVIAFDELFPADERGVFEAFPFHVLGRPASTLEAIHWWSSRYASTPRTPDLTGHSHREVLSGGGDRGMVLSRAGGETPVTGHSHGKEPSLLAVFQTAHEEFVAQNPRWRPLVVGFRDIPVFIPDSPMVSLEIEESPLRVLPSEWQVQLLLRLFTDQPRLVTNRIFQDFLKAAGANEFRLANAEPSLRLDGRLLPKNAQLAYILRRFRSHYFPAEGPIDPEAAREAFRRHVYFRVR